MNPGPVEEAGKVATGFIESMKSQPLALALAVMNVGLLLLFWAVLNKSTTRAAEREEHMFQEQKEVRNLLANCVVVPKT